MKKNFETHTWVLLEDVYFTHNYKCTKCNYQFFSNFSKKDLKYKKIPSCEEYTNECNVKDILL